MNLLGPAAALFRLALRLLWWTLRFCVHAVPFAVRLPVVVIRILVAMCHGVGRGLAWPGRLIEASRDEVICGHCGLRQSLLGRWRCPCCKANETTHAFAPCTACGVEVPAGYVACANPDCGEAIVHPRLRGLA